MNKKKDTSKEAEPIGNLLNRVLGKCRPDLQQDLTRIWDLWEEAVGETIAEHTTPAAFKGTILIVHVSSSPWMHQLQFLKKDILVNLNNALGQELITEIKFRIG